MTCILAIVMIILLALIKKYEQKITIDIDFPQKPFAYEIINIENIEKGISKQLLQLEYTKNLHQIASLDIYYNSKNIGYCQGLAHVIFVLNLVFHLLFFTAFCFALCCACFCSLFLFSCFCFLF